MVTYFKVVLKTLFPLNCVASGNNGKQRVTTGNNE